LWEEIAGGERREKTEKAEEWGNRNGKRMTWQTGSGTMSVEALAFPECFAEVTPLL
jgi:hypothetical protein